MTRIEPYLDAGYASLFVETFDEKSLEEELKLTGRTILTYSSSGLLVDRVNNVIEECGPMEAFVKASEKEECILLIRDLQHLLNNAGIYRALLEASPELKAKGSCVIAVAPHWKLPQEMIHEAPVLKQSMPSREQLQQPLDDMLESAGVEDLDPETYNKLLAAAAGLTLSEAENAFALSWAEVDAFDPAIVQREKMRQIGNTGYLTVEESLPADRLGGLGRLKDYVTRELIPVLGNAKLRVRGLIFAGLPGTGKSLAAQVLSSMVEHPLLRFDLEACKGSLQGQSGQNVRHALAVIEAVAPCVVWIDEAEKGVGGGGNAQTDGGTSAGMLGTLLTWLQKHTSPVLTVMTCNDYDKLPGPLVRPGRIDERFVLDLPTESERVKIAEVHLERFDCEVEYAQAIAERTKDWSGAEIEQVVKSAARLTQCDITVDAIEEAIEGIRPQSEIDREEVTRIRSRYNKVLRPANDKEAVKTPKGRKLARK